MIPQENAGSGIQSVPQGEPNSLPVDPENIGSNPIGDFLAWFGNLGIFFWQVVRAAVTPPFEFAEFFRQMDEIGSKSLPLVALAGAATGIVLSMEARYSLTRFGAKSLLPAAIVFSVIHETGPIITGLVVSGRVGAGIGAELASMKVTEQIDAIEASAVNPYRLLAATRILACIAMLPLLTLAADACGVIAGWFTQALAEPLSFHQFINSGFKGADFNDFLPPTFKTAVFGLIIGLIACYQGMSTKGGAAGVGRAATSSVVLASLFVILADVVLVKIILIFFP
ncbi:MAG: ABC transporter permease [Candidatus Sulfotelmatobacter sp.]|jgi:phospholipid/cholesterol/gamma-HCH transport system permease protein